MAPKTPRNLLLVLAVVASLAFSGCVAKSEKEPQSEAAESGSNDDLSDDPAEWPAGSLPEPDDWTGNSVLIVNGVRCERHTFSETVLAWTHPDDAPTSEGDLICTLPPNVTSVHQPAIVVETLTLGDLRLWVTRDTGDTVSDFEFAGLRAPDTEVSGWNSGTADWDDDHRDADEHTFHWTTTAVAQGLSYTLTVDRC